LLKRFYVTPTILVLSGNENLRILFPRKLCDSISTLEKPIEDETPISSHGFDTV
jgi:hypothetical protein